MIVFRDRVLAKTTREVCLLFNSHVFLSFFSFRWAREGSLPYHKASVLFPSEMKFAGADRKIFNKQACPAVKFSYELTRKIASCLNLDVTYTQENCKLLLVSLTADLDFSGWFNCMLLTV